MPAPERPTCTGYLGGHPLPFTSRFCEVVRKKPPPPGWWPEGCRWRTAYGVCPVAALDDESLRLVRPSGASVPKTGVIVAVIRDKHSGVITCV